MTNTDSTGYRRRILTVKQSDGQNHGSMSDRSRTGTSAGPARTAFPLNNPQDSLRQTSERPEKDKRPPETAPDDTCKGKRQGAKSPPLTPEQMRTLFPGQRAELLARFCKALAVTEDELPAFLTQPVAIPLKIGAAKSLIQNGLNDFRLLR